VVCPACWPYLHLVPKYLKWLPDPHDPGHMRLWRIGYALGVCFAVALAGLVALGWLALALLHHPALSHSKTISVHDAVGVAQLVFASVAGAGALVALVVAYRRQRVAEDTASHDRTRVLNERFTAIATQLGDAQPAVRLAGVHAMAGLADDWKENRQTCVDVLCAYLRLPYDWEPDEDADPGELSPAKAAYEAARMAYRANREVRHTIIRLIGAHLRPDAAVSWEGLNLDFTGVVFDGGDFTGARFSGGIVLFYGAQFAGGSFSFERAEFSGSRVSFEYARFTGGEVGFTRARFSGGQVSFTRAKFSGGGFGFAYAEFSGSEVSFSLAEFSGGLVSFTGAEFSGGQVNFNYAEFSGSRVNFSSASFFGGQVNFGDAKFSGGQVDFYRARIFGGEVSFYHAGFSGGQVDFSLAWDLSHPPQFDFDLANPPAGVKLPMSARARQT
jgi:uncharacterized protein YjbI with pentapeptide repeats